MEPDVFFDIVQTIRRRVQDTFDHDTLIEAIAEELERDYDFIALTDDRLPPRSTSPTKEADNFLADLEPDDRVAEEDIDDEGESETTRRRQSDRRRVPQPVCRPGPEPGPSPELTQAAAALRLPGAGPPTW